jgi:hypothetical protein
MLMNESIKAAQDSVYNEMLDIINNQLEIAGSADVLFNEFFF